MHKKKIVSSESHAPIVREFWRKSKARERGVSVVGVPVPDRGRQARVDGEQIARWNPRSSAASNGRSLYIWRQISCQ